MHTYAQNCTKFGFPLKCLKLNLIESLDSKKHFQCILSCRGGNISEKLNVRSIIKFNLCYKPHCVYSSSKINQQQTVHLKLIESDEEYTCGVPLVEDEGHCFRNSVVVQRSLTCQSAI